nr:NAD-binding protein [Natronolimnobius sp. AArcel1]
MAVYEGESRTWYQALEVVVQSMTTAGYGQDAPWQTLEMTALVMLIQITGIAYIVVAIPQFVVPWLETLIQPAPPEQIDHLSEHVIVVGYTALCDTLVEELETSGTPYVILEGDEDRAQQLHEDDFRVLHGDPSATETLEAACLEDALAVIVDATEREQFRTVLAIETRDPDATVVPLVHDPADARYFRYAGVDEVVSPRHRLGKALGDRVRTVLSPDLSSLELGTAFDIAEFHVDPDADLFGDSLAATQQLEDAGGTVLGAWVRGDFVTSLSDETTVDENTSLLVAGTDSDLEAIGDATGTTGSQYRASRDPVVILGSDLIGTTAAGTLERAGLEYTVVDSTADDHVDVHGDVADEETLLEAGLADAGTCLVALEDDTDALLATLTARALNPDLEVIAGASTATVVDALRTAGADYVLALPNVAGRLITLRIFDREVMTLEESLKLLEVDAPALVGETVSNARVADETECTVVALERDGEIYSQVDDVEFTVDDRLIVAGTDDQLERFRERYGDDESNEGATETA